MGRVKRRAARLGGLLEIAIMFKQYAITLTRAWCIGMCCSLCSLIPNLALAADYYLIAGNPSQEDDIHYPTTLFRSPKAKGSPLEFVRTITTSRQGAEFIRSYDDLGLVVIGSRGGPHLAQFDIIQYDDVLRMRQLEIEEERGYFPFGVYMLDHHQQGPVLVVEEPTYDNNKKISGSHVRALDMDGTKREVSRGDFLDIHNSAVPASSGGYVLPDFYRSFGESDGVFTMGVDDGAIPTPFPGPDLSAYKNKDGVVQAFRNAHQRVMSSYEMTDELYVMDSKSMKWTKIVVEGDRTTVHGFGNMLGFVIEYTAANEKTLPGVKKRESNRYFEDPAQRLGVYFRTGKVVLLNNETGKRTEMNLGAADIDILWLQPDRVLYRVESSIYERALSDKGLGDEKLLVKNDEIVPAIHWAFPASSVSDKKRAHRK